MSGSEMRGVVMAVCVSQRRGIDKTNVQQARLAPQWGIEGDAHGGKWHRQVSLLSYDKIVKFNEEGAGVSYGDFGENIVVSGIDFRSLRPETRLLCGEAELAVTQIGKECHTHCAVYNKMGDCIMPREGVFARVIKGGVVSVGGEMLAKPFEGLLAAVVTLSDKGARGERADRSGQAVEELLRNGGYTVFERLLLPDDREEIEKALVSLSDYRRADLIITTGGTGFSKRDVTPEATLAIAERNAPGIAEAIRAHSLTITGRAMLGRGVSVIRGETVIVNLPGSVKAVEESLSYILPHLRHGIDILRGGGECGGECGGD